MKQVFSILTVAMLLVMGVSHANAQKGEWKMDLNYNYSMPLGSFKKDIISHNSPRGFGADFMYGINSRWSLGLQSGYQDYYQKYPRDLYQTGQHEVTSAVLSNSIQTIPIVLKAAFNPLASTTFPLKPYVSAGAGFELINFNQYLGEFGSNSTDAGFTAKAGAGLMVSFGKLSNVGVNVGADYNYTSYKKYGYSNLNNVSLHAGIYFPLR